MKLTVKRFVLVLAAGLLTSSAAQAASLGVYNFAGSDPTGDAAKPTFTNLTYTSFTRTGVNSSGVADVFASRDWWDSGEPTTGSGAPFNSGEYVGFTVTVDANYTLTLNRLNFDAQLFSGGPNLVRVAYSTSPGFANPTTSSDMSVSTTMAGKVFDFADFTSLPGATVEFRFYGAGATAATGRQYLDNVTLDGSVAEVVPVPEPAAFALFGLAGLSMLRRRRR